MVDHYCNPGPIQFTDEGADSVSDIISTMYKVENDIADQIIGLCNAVHNETMFTEHPHLLVAALSALQSAKGVLGSMSEGANLNQLKAMYEVQKY